MKLTINLSADETYNSVNPLALANAIIQLCVDRDPIYANEFLLELAEHIRLSCVYSERLEHKGGDDDYFN